MAGSSEPAQFAFLEQDYLFRSGTAYSKLDPPISFYQSRKYMAGFPKGQSGGDIFLTEVPSSQMTPACMTLTRKLTRTSVALGLWNEEASTEESHWPIVEPKQTMLSLYLCSLTNLTPSSFSQTWHM